jgi:hypothetical protein
MSLLLITALAAGISTSADTLSDAALVAYAKQPYDKALKFNHRDVLGIHHGAKVVADFPCSDICPTYTVRVIHYDVAPGPDCDRIGGRAVKRMVPVSIAVMKETFCEPAVLADEPQ